MPAPIGNQNARKARLWTAAIDRALEKRSKALGIQALDEIAGVLVDKCLEGEQWAIKELGERKEGKVSQTVELTGDEDAPIITRIVIESVASPKRE